MKNIIQVILIISMIAIVIFPCYAKKPQPMCKNGHQRIHCNGHSYFHADCPRCILVYEIHCHNP
jgi:hypothetical protein